MPFEKIITTPVGRIGIWSLRDSSDELATQCTLSEIDQLKFDNFIAERRKKEFLASRILLQKLLNKNAEIEYNQAGKPYLKHSNLNISISHSVDFACVFISEKNIGIDVEQTTRIIDKIATRFLHPKEQEFIAGLQKQQEAKLLFWAAKEAIFKCIDDQGIEFNKQIFIQPFSLSSEGTCKGSLQLMLKKVNFKLHYFFMKNNVVVYCVEE